MSAEEWMRILLAMGILTAMFVFPIVTIWHNERRKRREAQDREATSAMQK